MRCLHVMLFPALFLVVLDYTRAQDNTNALHAVAQSNGNFSNAIYQILARQEGNVFFSPISIEVILALTYLGARGNTAQQMAAGLQLPADREVVKHGFNALLTSLKANQYTVDEDGIASNVTLNIANNLYVERTFNLKEQFTKIAREGFLSDVESVDFRTRSEVTRVLINKWVEKETNGKIKDLLAPGLLNAATKLVLVNALHFKGAWAHPFEPMYNAKKPFYQTPTKTKMVDMMYNNIDCRYAIRKDLSCSVLELPYIGEKFSMVILLPNKIDGLAALESKLPSVGLSKVLTELQGPRKVDVWLPKFKIEHAFDLKPVLKEMGMVDMFDNTADLSGIADGRLAVSQVVHKAYIEVTEEGSEAAAATVLDIEDLMYIEPIHFKIDHPFLFVLRDTSSGAVLFMGRVATL